MKLIIPENYESGLSMRETHEAIKYIRDTFQKEFAKQMNLSRISALAFSVFRTLRNQFAYLVSRSFLVTVISTVPPFLSDSGRTDHRWGYSYPEHETGRSVCPQGR